MWKNKKEDEKNKFLFQSNDDRYGSDGRRTDMRRALRIWTLFIIAENF